MSPYLSAFPEIQQTPTRSGLPGANLIQSAVNWLGWLAGIAAVASLLIGGSMWGLGHLSSNPAGATRGRQIVIGGLICALIAGGAFVLVREVWTAGETLTGTAPA